MDKGFRITTVPEGMRSEKLKWKAFYVMPATCRLPDKPSASNPMEPMHRAPCHGHLSGRISGIRFYSVNSSDKISIMGFHINKKTAEKNAASTKSNKQSGNSKFLSKGSTKSAGAVKKPIKTGGTRGS